MRGLSASLNIDGLLVTMPHNFRIGLLRHHLKRSRLLGVVSVSVATPTALARRHARRARLRQGAEGPGAGLTEHACCSSARAAQAVRSPSRYLRQASAN